MRVAQLERPQPLAAEPLVVVERPAVGPAAGEVLVEVIACGLCRTDLQLCSGDLDARRLPIVPGHQVVGVVREVGPGARRLSVGDRVGVAWLGGACGACGFCGSGRENLCPDAVFTGWDRDGGFAEAIVADEGHAHPIPPGIADLDAAPLLCGGTIGLRSLRIAGVTGGERLGLYGFGASATIVIQIARHWGCEVYVVTRNVDEQRRALELGAAWAGSYDERPPVPLDAAITFAPVGSVVVAALAALERGGTVAVNAIHLDEIPAFDYGLLWSERSIRSVANVTRADVTELLDLAAAVPLATQHAEYPLAAVNEAMRAVEAGDVRGAAVIVP